MNKPTLWLLVGIPASGKSTAAASIAKHDPDSIHISRDAIRYSMLCDDESYFAHEEDVFTELQYNSSSFERTELIRNYLNKILDLMAATKAAIPEDGEY